MTESGPVTLFGDLSKPATTLIEKISDAIGGVFRPHQIRRIAKAESNAALIRAATQIEVSELQRRALERFVQEEARKQDNIESITSKAIPDVNEQAKPGNIENDWLVNFFDKCRLISNDEMQTLWARVLSAQANEPGTFSKRTVSLLASLDKSDADAFTRLCSFCIEIGDPVPLVYDVKHSIYTENGIDFTVLSQLDSIGLIQFSALAGFAREGFGQNGFVRYFDQLVWIEFPNPANNKLETGRTIFTKAGIELSRICGGRPINGFTDYIKEKWREFGISTERSPEKVIPPNTVIIAAP